MSEQVTATLRDLNARPLGVRPDVPLTDAQWTALQRLEDYDLAPVRARLLNRGVLPAERVDDAIFEFRRFLGLLIVGDRELPMVSAAVDEVWHTCLLFTRLYADLCEQTVGRFVHHEPMDVHEPSAGNTGDGSGPLETGRAFQQAYTRVYGAALSRMEPSQQEPAAGTANEGLWQDAQLDQVAGGGGLAGGVLACATR
ncbi:MAG TPA: hypothetical protein VII06_26710 [Chloroflexota bacterium]|jgi:hypothetical protein